VVLCVAALLQVGIAIEDHSRSGHSGPVWQPIVWEVSSAASLALLIPFVYWTSYRFSFAKLGWVRWGAIHVMATIPFALAHVAAMGGLREFAYAFTDYEYDAANLVLGEFFYEYKKDLVTYFICLACIAGLKKIELNSGFKAAAQPDGRRLKLRSDQGLIFVDPARIETLETAGNYVVVTTPDESFETRISLAALIRQCDGEVVQIHRRFAVGTRCVQRVERIRSGDGVVVLISGRALRLSRRYWSELKAALSRYSTGNENATT